MTTFSKRLQNLRLSKSQLARDLDISPEQISRWGEAPPQYALAYIKQLEKNQEIEAKLNYFINDDQIFSHKKINFDSISKVMFAKPYQEASISHVSEILDSSKSTIAVFTHGQYLEIRDNDTGSTGNWVMDPEKDIEKILVYWRQQSSGKKTNEIYLGDFVWAEGPLEDGRRYRLHFKNLIKVGITHENWKDFTGGGANPVKYFG